MILICLSGLVLAIAGCGEAGGSDGVDVMATTAVAADVVRHVAGPDAGVETLLPRGASPHDFGVSAKDRAELDEADLVVAWGSGLEAGLPLDDVDPLELAAGEHDPHVWMDPLFMARAVHRVAAALAQEDPAHAGGYRRRGRRYAAELRALDHEIRRTLAPLPAARRRLVTSHDSLGHFAARYGFDVVGAAFGLVPGAEPSAETVAELVKRIEREHVPAVFADETDDPEVLDQVAREAHVRVVDDLLIEGFGDGVDSYEEMLRFDARRIGEALGR